MNTRLLEILKNPDLLVLKDIEILEKEISKHPFVQSYRALYLLGMHRFEEKKYAGKLSETAAFTTDKKILYQLIHQKDISTPEIADDEQKEVEVTLPEVQSNENLEESEPISKVEKLISLPAETFQEIDIVLPHLPGKVYVDGELNRILFEGEENFLEEDSEEIDLEASQEAGTLVIASKNNVSGEFSENTSDLKAGENSPVMPEITETADNGSEESPIKFTNTFSTEKILNEADINANETVLEKPSALSFHGIDPEIIRDNIDERSEAKIEKESSAKSPEEGTREFTKEKIINEDAINDEENEIEEPSQLSFHGSQEFLPGVKIKINYEGNNEMPAQNKSSKQENEMQKLIAEVEAKMKKSSSEKIKIIEDADESSGDIDFTEEHNNQTPQSPIRAENNFDNSSEFKQSKENLDPCLNLVKSSSEPFNIKQEIPHNQDELESNESFVTDKDKSEITLDESPIEDDKIVQDEDESNVPVFINTWQSWLQLNPGPAPVKESGRQKAIETFIQKEPKISKLKEESSFNIKEKGDNISHLMTETLANLYLDQKLYAKAIKAFELLIEKLPEKAERFSDKIAEIKVLRSQK